MCDLSDHTEGLLCQNIYLEYKNKIHNWLTETEVSFMPNPNYLKKQTQIRHSEREILINWLIIIQVEFNLQPETLYITVNIIDRFLSKKRIALDRLQLLGITAMHIASKFQEIYPPIMSDFIQMTKNSFRARQMSNMETDVLKVIAFDINCTPTQTFLENYSRAIGVSEPRVLIYTSFLLDLSLIKAEFLYFRPSHITVCALAMAIMREQRLTGQDYSEKLHYLEEVMELEQYDGQTFKQCKRLFDKFTGKLGTEGLHLPNTTSLVRKYAGTGALNFEPKALKDVLRSSGSTRQTSSSH